MATVGKEQKGSGMTERPPAYVNLERCLERLDRTERMEGRVEQAASAAETAAQPSSPLTLLAQLTQSVQKLPNAAGIAPLLGQVREHVEALCPAPGATGVDAEAHAAHMEQLEALFQTLEGVLYACSLPAR